MNSVKHMDSMGANTERLPKPKPAGYSGPRDLTPQEIESLRQDRKQAHMANMAYFAKVYPRK